MFSNTTGNGNTAIGQNSQYFNSTASNNTSIGSTSLQNNSTGGNNTAIGVRSLLSNTTGQQNVALGYNAGSAFQTGSNNTLIGYSADISSDGLTNATAIGSNAKVGASNALVLGNTGTNVGIETTTPDSTFSVADKFMVNAQGMIQYETAVPTLMSMYQGASAADKMVIQHSPANANWGLQYKGATNKFNFLSAGTSVMSIDLGTSQVTLGTNGTAFSELIKLTVNSDVASVGAGSSLTHTFAVANAALNSSVMVSPATALPDGLMIAYARVSAAGTVEVKFINTTAAPIDPAAMDYYITVVR